MIVRPDKNSVRERFSRAAPGYDGWAEPQQRMASRLLDFLPETPRPESILELGCGTGLLTERLAARWPEARIHAVDLAPGMISRCRKRWGSRPLVDFHVADAESIFCTEQFDWVLSNSLFQWIGDRPAAFRRLRGLLAPGGRMAFSVPIEGTLPELADSYLEATGEAVPTLDLWTARRYEEALSGAAVPVEITSVETVRVYYRNPAELLRALKGIGATLAGQQEFPHLSPARTRRLLDACRRRFGESDGRVPCTYRVLYALSEAVL